MLLNVSHRFSKTPITYFSNKFFKRLISCISIILNITGFFLQLAHLCPKQKHLLISASSLVKTVTNFKQVDIIDLLTMLSLDEESI